MSSQPHTHTHTHNYIHVYIHIVCDVCREYSESELALVRCRRELRDKSTRCDTLNTQLSTLEKVSHSLFKNLLLCLVRITKYVTLQSHDLLKTSHARVLQEMETLHQKLKEV